MYKNVKNPVDPLLMLIFVLMSPVLTMILGFGVVLPIYDYYNYRGARLWIQEQDDAPIRISKCEVDNWNRKRCLLGEKKDGFGKEILFWIEKDEVTGKWQRVED